MKIFLDSSIIIEKIKQRELLDQKKEYWINAIVYAEVGYGFLRIGKSLREWEMWLKINRVSLIDIGLLTARTYTRLKLELRQNPIDEKDLLIASSCIDAGGRLWTLNVKHFERVPGIDLFE